MELKGKIQAWNEGKYIPDFQYRQNTPKCYQSGEREMDADALKIFTFRLTRVNQRFKQFEVAPSWAKPAQKILAWSGHPRSSTVEASEEAPQHHRTNS